MWGRVYFANFHRLMKDGCFFFKLRGRLLSSIVGLLAILKRKETNETTGLGPIFGKETTYSPGLPETHVASHSIATTMFSLMAIGRRLNLSLSSHLFTSFWLIFLTIVFPRKKSLRVHPESAA